MCVEVGSSLSARTVCEDCYAPGYSSRNYTDPDGLTSWEHCAQTDSMPSRCDFLAQNQEGARLNRFVLVIVVAMLTPALAKDMDQGAMEVVSASHQLATLQCPDGVRRMLQVLLWCICYLRLYVVPATVMMAATALMVTNELTVQNVVLNGMAIVFIVQLDDDLIGLIYPQIVKQVHQNFRDTLQGAYGSGDKDREHKMQRCWIARKVYCGALAIMSIVTILNIELFIRNTPIPGNTSFGTSKALCGDVVDVILHGPIMWVMLIGVLTHQIVELNSQPVILRDIVCGLILLIFTDMSLLLPSLLA
mmetsp:Transcript_3795/g.5979  ORF Transcript_3795/g.5979 Transcript_3795/m.5979 type:complete len:305 (+) Transcript_3795:291-1205(+)